MKSFKRYLLPLGLAALLVVSLSPAAPKKDQRLRIIIEDNHAAAWMSISNSFAEVNDNWEGFLIQLGNYLEDDGAVFDIFGTVTFERNGLPLHELERGDFRWINLVADDGSGRGIPMGMNKLWRLYPDPEVPPRCERFDRCSQKCSDHRPKGKPTSGPFFEPCLRQRSLHGFFFPFAVITLWQGLNGLDIQIETRFDLEQTSTFFFNDPVLISVDGDPLDLGEIDTIRVSVITEPNHGGKHDPGW